MINLMQYYELRQSSIISISLYLVTPFTKTTRYCYELPKLDILPYNINIYISYQPSINTKSIKSTIGSSWDNFVLRQYLIRVTKLYMTYDLSINYYSKYIIMTAWSAIGLRCVMT